MSVSDHPLRYRLANELHARPFPSFDAPTTAAFLAIKQATAAAGRDKQHDLAHLILLLDRFGAPHPQPGATHYSGTIGRHTIKWEQHSEFVTYSVFTNGVSDRPFDQSEFDVFPKDWLAKAPGVRITSALLRVEPMPQEESLYQKLADWFVPESLSVSYVLDRSAIIAGDFRIDASGHLRFAIFAAPETGPQRLGRIAQRLCEIETYKAMSMLGFERSKTLSEQMGRVDEDLGRLMDAMTRDVEPDATLAQLLQISAQLESEAARSSYRFGATRAYEAIVMQRIEVLREERYRSRQTFREFMTRRYTPAMRTVEAIMLRQQDLADRARRAGELLRTKVDVARSAQNQALLESMDRRADLALRLQETVEGLSVVAISYYAVNLLSYALYPFVAGLGVSKALLSAALVVPVVVLVWFGLHRVKGRLK